MPPPTMEQQPTPPTAPEAAPVHRPPPRNVPTLTEMVAADAERQNMIAAFLRAFEFRKERIFLRFGVE